MTRLPDTELVLIPGGTLITATPEQGRALALTLARHTVHNIQPDLEVLKAGRSIYAANADSLIAASQVVALEFQTIAAANDYWRNRSSTVSALQRKALGRRSLHGNDSGVPTKVAY